MKLIGEFAKENNVTVRALHHYEKLGLIIPNTVDSFTGYRYYDDSQAAHLQMIGFLKELGFSLSEIKAIFDKKLGRTYLLKVLDNKKTQAVHDTISADIRQNRISNLLNALDKNKSEVIDIKELVNMNDKGNTNELDGPRHFRKIANQLYTTAIKENKPFATLSIDIDSFYSVNKRFGHDVGDIVISRISDALISVQMSLNKNDKDMHSMMERQGGDEFRVILNDTDDVAEKLAKSMITKVQAIDFTDVAADYSASISVGLASLSYNPHGCSHMFHLAESALFEVKANNKGSFGFYKE